MARRGIQRGARQIARDVLSRVGARRGFANRELDAAFKKRRDLEARDRGLATEIVYGVLRRRATLDHHIARFSKAGLDRIERGTIEAVRVALYQVLYLDRIPAAAAVNDAVEAVPKRAKGFANGLLRNLLRNRDSLTCEDLAGRPAAYLATVHSHPEWLVERWLDRFGAEETARLLSANNERPPVCLRTNLLRITRDGLLDRLAADGLDAEPSPYVPEAILLGRAPDLSGLSALRNGLGTVQDEAAQAVVHLLDVRPDQRVLDACAAPGGKATHAAERMGDRGEIWALDVDRERLRQVEQNALRLGLRAVKTVRGDAASPPEEVRSRPFDRVLVDAPCSALGLLRKQPEIRWRRRTEDPADLSSRQQGILEGICSLVGPGGSLVYAVCTFEPEETEHVIGGFLARHSEFRLRPAREVLTGGLAPLAAKDGYLRTHAPGLMMDGFFAARLEREAD